MIGCRAEKKMRLSILEKFALEEDGRVFSIFHKRATFWENLEKSL